MTIAEFGFIFANGKRIFAKLLQKVRYYDNYYTTVGTNTFHSCYR